MVRFEKNRYYVPGIFLEQPEGMAFEEAAEIAAVDVELLRGRV